MAFYATTVHELTHAGHRELDPGMFSVLHLGDKERLMLRESWAEGVETIVTNDRYKRLNPNYKSSQPGDNGGRWNAGRQRQTAFQMDEYTPIVEDLIDNLNQGITPPNSGFPADRVIGYNLNQIQNALNK